MSFDRPLLLALALPWVALVLLGARRLARHPLGLRGARLRGSVIVQCLLGLAVTLAAAGARVVRRDPRLAVVIVVDRSRSTDLVPDVDARLRALLADAPGSMRRGDLLGVVAFAREPDTALRPSPLARDAVLPVPVAAGPRDDSDLAAAVLHALGDVPADTQARVALVSDGDETRGDLRSAAMIAAAAGVPIDTVALSRPSRRDVSVTRLRTPARLEQGRPVDLAAVVRADRAGSGRVTLIRDGRRLGDVPVRWGAGEDVIHLRDEGLSPGLHRYEVRLATDTPDDDQVPGNEVAAGFVRVAGGARALVLSGRASQGGGEALAGALRAAGLEVDRVGPESAPSQSGQWARYDLIVLSDVRARELDPGTPALLREHVRELGAGLWMVGSDRAFGPGGYGHSPVEDVLPVTLDLRQHRMRGRVALAIVIDRSGSMGAPTRDGRTKIDLANEGAARSAAMLAPDDLIGISHVDTATTWTWPMSAASDPAAIQAAARTGGAGGGGIDTGVGLRDAYAVLHGASATLRHVILLADGDDAENSDGCEAMAREAAAQRITTSVVAIGRGHDEGNLERIARAGQGRYYLTEDARSLPAIFTEETVTAARNPIREEPFTPRLARGAEVLRGFDPATAPRVTGWVVTEARPRAEVLLRAPEDDPWLARWQVGAGRAAALTSDLDGRWTRDFLAWPGATSMMGQVGAWLARGVADRGVRVTAAADRGRVRVEVDATTAAGRWDTGLDLEARVLAPDGSTVRVPLEARGAGRYGADVDAPRSGSWIVTVTSAGQGVVGVTGAEVVASAEVTARTGDAALLAEVSSRTGGRVRTDLRGLYDVPRSPRARSRSMERALLWAALALLLIEVALRRLPAPSLAPARAWWAKRSQRPAPTAESDGTDDALAAMRAKRFPR
ncbi:MAG: VWA domain-containing protein [Polyangiales bacterium]